MRQRIVLYVQAANAPFTMARNDGFHFDLDGALGEARAQLEAALKDGVSLMISLGLEPERLSNEKLT